MNKDTEKITKWEKSKRTEKKMELEWANADEEGKWPLPGHSQMDARRDEESRLAGNNIENRSKKKNENNSDGLLWAT